MENKLIVVVEDSSIIRELVKDALLKRGNVDVKTFGSGEQLLKELKDKPDLLILDYYLDGQDRNAMNGFEILQKLSNKMGTIPTIVLSGMKDDKLKDKLIGMGVLDFIDKDEDDIFLKIDAETNKYLTA